jgi:hypothetical protein
LFVVPRHPGTQFVLVPLVAGLIVSTAAAADVVLQVQSPRVSKVRSSSRRAGSSSR